MDPVVQISLPSDLWCHDRGHLLPGIRPLEMANWLVVDDAYAGQMALRDDQIINQRSKVLALEPEALSAARELLGTVLKSLEKTKEFQVGKVEVIRPDGRKIPINWDDPLACAGRLVQEDICILQLQGCEHVMTGAVLCFPAGWTLQEKMGRSLMAIHGPVKSYDNNIAHRVQRMFDNIRVEQPLWRYNGFPYETPVLFAPFTEDEPRPKLNRDAPYFRVERQCLLRLPQTQSVVFSIHTYMVARTSLSGVQANCIEKHFD